MSSLTGQLLASEYRVGALLGEGGMGAVYEAVHERLGRQVAVKVLHARAELSAAALARFEREARAAAALQHPGIVQVTDFQANPGEPPFIVMERLVGESLRARIRREGRVDPGQACFFVSQVLDALETAHRAGIIHRDIKPDNVHLTSVGSGVSVAKVLDFGIAKLKNEAPLTQNGAMLGSPAYMSPEQARGEPLDARADVYGVGALAYHAISGNLPIDERGGALDVLRAIVDGAPPPLDAVVPGLPPGLSALVARAMAKRPEQRFASAAAMLEAVRPFVRVGAPAAARPSDLASTAHGPPGPSGPVAYAPFAAAPIGPPPGAWGPPGGAPPGGPPPGGPPPGGPPPGASYGAPPGGPPSPVAYAQSTLPPGGPPPMASMAQAPRTSSSGALVLWLVGAFSALVLAAAAIAAVAFVMHREDDAPPSAAAKPAVSASAASAYPSATSAAYPSSATSAAVPAYASSAVPPASPRVTPSAAPSTCADAGRASGVVDPPPAPATPVAVVDAGAPKAAGARSVAYTGFSLGPFGSGTQAADTVRAQLPTFRPCAPLACVGVDRNRESYRFLDSRYDLTVNDVGQIVTVRASNSVTAGVPVACPALDACMIPKVRAIKFPKPVDTPRDARLSFIFRE